jgi:hypothetical protein
MTSLRRQRVVPRELPCHKKAQPASCDCPQREENVLSSLSYFSQFPDGVSHLPNYPGVQGRGGLCCGWSRNTSPGTQDLEMAQRESGRAPAPSDVTLSIPLNFLRLSCPISNVKLHNTYLRVLFEDEMR